MVNSDEILIIFTIFYLHLPYLSGRFVRLNFGFKIVTILNAMESKSNYLFSSAEWNAIHVHKHYLSEQIGHEVCLKDTIDSWMKHYAKEWRKLAEERWKEPDGEQRYCPAEWKAIKIHRYFLSQRYHRRVSVEETIEDWMKRYAQVWREKRMELSSRNQMEQILKHKWLESQKSGYDVGKVAAADWITKYAEVWRRWWESE